MRFEDIKLGGEYVCVHRTAYSRRFRVVSKEESFANPKYRESYEYQEGGAFSYLYEENEGIPIEPAPDPVEEKAKELYGVLNPEGDWLTTWQGDWRRLARHVLGVK